MSAYFHEPAIIVLILGRHCSSEVYGGARHCEAVYIEAGGVVVQAAEDARTAAEDVDEGACKMHGALVQSAIPGACSVVGVESASQCTGRPACPTFAAAGRSVA